MATARKASAGARVAAGSRTTTASKPASTVRTAAAAKKGKPAKAVEDKSGKAAAAREEAPTLKQAASAKPGKAKPAAGKPVAGKSKADEAVTGKALKPKKQKLVRDSFTMPESEYALLAEVKKACIANGFSVKKSELLRVGVALIRTLDQASLKTWIESLPPLKPGRPRKDRQAA